MRVEGHAPRREGLRARAEAWVARQAGPFRSIDLARALDLYPSEGALYCSRLFFAGLLVREQRRCAACQGRIVQYQKKSV